MNRTVFLLAGVLLLLGTGCHHLRQGWKQERELLDQFPRSVAAGWRNGIRPLLPSYGVGWRATWEDWHPFDGFRQGVRADVDYWTGH